MTCLLPDHRLTALWMNSTVLSELVGLSHPDEMVRHLCEQLKKLTGAKTVSFLLHADGHPHGPPLCVLPPQCAELFNDEKLSQVCPAAHPDPIPVQVQDLPAAAPLRKQLEAAGIDNLLRFPICSAGQLTGTFVLADLTDVSRAGEICSMMELLGPAIGLAIENCKARQKIQEQRDTFEEQVTARTAELEQANLALNNARLAALNMMEDAMQAKQRLELTQFALDHADTAVFWINQDASIHYANQTACQILGYAEDELTRLSIPDVDIDMTAQGWAEHWEQMKVERSLHFEMHHKRRDGEVFPVEIHSSFIDHDGKEYIFAFAHDIRERKQAEAERERLMAAINQVAETIVITDTEGTIEYVNPAFEKITGYTCGEVIGQNPRILKSGEHDGPFYQNLWDTLLRGETWTGRLINKKKDGTFGTEEAAISPVKDAAGQVVNYVAVKRDVTEELQMEEQLRQSQKMQSIGQLVGGVAHDFNNLLQIINGYAQLALTRLEPTHDAVSALTEIAGAGARAKEIVQQLLAFSRQQVINPVELDLNREIESSRKMLGRLIGAPIRLEFIAGEIPGRIFSDQGQIQQVLMNLCVNARDAMPDGGTLTLKTETVSIGPDELKASALTRPGRYVLLSVRDTGCGMDKKTCAKIFEPFFTTKEVGKGTGLGLSTVYGIVNQNEGQIQVHSEPGQGTVFNIYLPIASPLPASVLHSICEPTEPEHVGVETILVVEDDAVILELATQILGKAGYTVLTAEDGEKSVQVFQQHQDEIDLVMMDVVMPRMGGKDAMKRILKIRPAMRYLFVSGYSQETGDNDLIQDKLLDKPYTVAGLLHKIREMLEN
jgi:PAS domain S-box-containing protein